MRGGGDLNLPPKQNKTKLMIWKEFKRRCITYNILAGRDKITTSKLRGAYDKFPDFFRIGTFIESTHMKL